jgi:hypothetical protein
MKIFVAYGFNARDQWIPDLVFPLIGAFGAEVVTGEQAHDGTISSVVTDRIKDCNALIAFATRRGNQKLPDGTYETHRWVTDELAYALALNRPAVEVRETGVSVQRGLAGDRQPIAYDEATRDRCLVELAKAVGAWCRGVTLSFQLLPRELEAEIRPLLRRPGFRCAYTLLEQGREAPEAEARIVPQPGGLFVYAAGVPLDALIRVQVQGGGASWISDYESLSSRSITLARE